MFYGVTGLLPYSRRPAIFLTMSVQLVAYLCLGWLTFTGHDRGNPCKLVSFASKLPSWADEHRPPVSLRTLLSVSMKTVPPTHRVYKRDLSDSRAVPDSLAAAVQSMAASGTGGSYHFFSFYDAESTDLRTTRPF